MNFLALVQTLRSEAGIAGSGPVSVTGQSGELLRLVNWVANSNIDIQDKRADWSFLRNEFSFNTVIGTAAYATSVANLANWREDSLRIYKTSTGVVDEQPLLFMPYERFRDTRLMGANRTASGRPIDFTIQPDRSLQLWPCPDAIYSITGEYYRTALALVNDTDEPVFSRFHMAIVYNALMRYAAYSEAPVLFAYGQREYNRLIGKLEAEQTPAIVGGGALC